ncbi:unnamed protein product, partial [Cochlearia groenlandica]
VPLIQPSYRSPAQMEAEIQTLYQKQTKSEKTFALYNNLFPVLSFSNLELQHIMQTYPNRPTQPPPNTIDPDNATHDYFGDVIDFYLGGGSDHV